MLGDLNIAEPKALIGFAGPRVIEQTIRQKLPEGFQRSEFLLEHGMLDLVVDRRELKAHDRARAALHGSRAPAPPAAPCRRRTDRRRRGRHPQPRVTTSVLDRLLALETFGIKLGLDNIARLCEALGHPERAFATAASSPAPTARARSPRWSNAALRAAGHRTGRYTSPHLVDLERTLRDRRRAGRRRDASTTPSRTRARPSRIGCAGRHARASRRPSSSHHGRRVRAVPARRRRRSRCIEVGLGGRFDATNVVDPDGRRPSRRSDSITSSHLGRDACGDRLREGRHHQAGHAGRRPASCRRARSGRRSASPPSAARALVPAHEACEAQGRRDRRTRHG